MSIHRAPDSPGLTHTSFEESSVRRAPEAIQEDDDAYELQDHEFTLEPEEPEVTPDAANARDVDERAVAERDGDAPAVAERDSDEQTAPWTTLQPLPPWAATARALLDEEATPAELSASAALALRAELTHVVRECEALQRSLADTRRALSETYAQLAHERGRIAGQALLIAELELRARRTPPPQLRDPALEPAPRSAAAPPDDLQRIRGLGKRFAARLAALGVARFAEIARWTAADIARVAAELGVRAERIQREGWVRQARSLQAPRASMSARPRTPQVAERTRKAAKRKRTAR